MSKLFWNIIAKRYSKQPISNEDRYQKKLEITRKYFRSDMRVLEFGCGTGSTALIHAPYVEHILAIDYSKKMIDIANNKLEKNDVKNITFECTSVEKLAENEPYDLVLALNIIHLLPNYEKTISKIHRTLKPNGIFISSTGCVGNASWFLKAVLRGGNLLGILPYLNFFEKDDFKRNLEQHGFVVEQEWSPEKSDTLFLVLRKN